MLGNNSHWNEQCVIMYISRLTCCISVGRTMSEEFGDTKGVIRFRQSKDREQNGQKKKDKQRSTKHYK